MTDNNLDSVLHLTGENFQQTLEDAGSQPVLVDFYADWCGPCRMAAPVIQKIAEEYQGKAVIAKVDVDAEGELARQYGVMSIPTVITFQNRQPVETKIGFAGESGYTSMIDKLLKN